MLNQLQLYNTNYTTNLGYISDVVSAFVTEERNGDFELELVVLRTDPLYSQLKEGNIVVCNASDILLNQKFRIYSTRKMMNNTVEIIAKHISFDLAYDYIKSISITSQSCQYALGQIFANSKFSTHYKGYSDIVNTQSTELSMTSVLGAIGGVEGSIIDTYGLGADILRDNENIHVLNSRGLDRGVTIEYGKNLTGIELTEDTTDLITGIVGMAIVKDESGNESIVEGDVVYSPLVNNYAHPYISIIDYTSEFKNDEPITKARLQELATNEFVGKNIDKPKQNYKIDFIPLSKCVGYEGLSDKISLCDTVTIKDLRYGVDTKAKVIKTVFNVLKNRMDTMELGDPRTSLLDIVQGGIDKEETATDKPIIVYPDTLPTVPVLSGEVYGFSSVSLSWTFENQVQYTYELYASTTKDFTPNAFDKIFEGKGSSFLHVVEPNQTWYYRVCGINSYGRRTDFSNQVTLTTVKVGDLANYVSEGAIGNALIGTLRLDRGWVGRLTGQYVDAKNLSVTDGNGKRTLDIDTWGNVNLDVSSLKIRNQSIDGLTTVNLIKNSNFTATPKHQNWQFWSSNPSSTNSWWYLHQHADYPTGEGIGISCSKASENCTATSSEVSVVSGEYYTVSMELLVENNVNHSIIMVREIDHTGAYVHEHEFRYERNFEGRTSNTFQVTHPNTKKVCIIIWHKGAVADGSNYVVVFFNRVQLQRGTVATAWQNGIDDEGARRLASLEMTSQEFEFKFENHGKPNLLPNSNPTPKNFNGWWYDGAQGFIYTYNPDGKTLGIANESTTGEACIHSPSIKVNPNTKYSISLKVCKEFNVASAAVYIIGSRDTNYNYDWTPSLTQEITTTNVWVKVEETITIPSDINYIRIRIDNDKFMGQPGGGGYVVWFHECMIIEGEGIYPDVWYPSTNEVINNVTTINNEGVKVRVNDGQGAQGYSQLTAQGLIVSTGRYNSNGTEILTAHFGQDNSATIGNLTVTGDLRNSRLIRNNYGRPTDFYINPTATGDGSGRDTNNYSNSINHTLRWIKDNYGVYSDAQDLQFHINNGVYNESIFVSGWFGSGVMRFYFDNYATWYGQHTFEECTMPIQFIGRRWNFGQWINEGCLFIKRDWREALFNVRTCTSVEIAQLRALKEGWSGTGGDYWGYSNYFAEVTCGSNVLIKHCDMVGFYWGVVSHVNTNIQMVDNRGHIYRPAYAGVGSYIRYVGNEAIFSQPVESNEYGHIVVGEYYQCNSMYQPKGTPPPPVVTENWQWTEGTFTCGNLRTVPEGTGSSTSSRSGEWGQGKWDVYKAHRGYADVSGINGWCSGGRNFTGWITLTRSNTSHGVSGATPRPRLKMPDGSFWDCGVGFARGQTSEIQLPWEITNALVNGSMTTLEMWAGTSSNDYSFYNSSSVKIRCEKKV